MKFPSIAGKAVLFLVAVLASHAVIMFFLLNRVTRQLNDSARREIVNDRLERAAVTLEIQRRLWAGLSPKELVARQNEFLANISVSPDRLFVLSADGKILGPGAGDGISDRVFREIVSAPPMAALECALNGVDHWVYARRFEPFHWTLAYAVPAHREYMGIRSFMPLIYGSLALAALVSLLAGVFLACRLKRDIVSLTQATGAMVEGDFRFPLGITHRDELGDLARRLESARAAFRRQMEAIQEQEAMLRGVLMTVPASIGRLKNREVCYINQGITTITGYTAAEILANGVASLYFTREEYARVGAFYPRLKTEGKVTVETVWKKKDGSRLHVLLGLTKTNEALDDDNVTFVAIDITESVKTRQALAGERKRLTQILESIPAFLYLQKHDGRVIYSNRRFRELFFDADGNLSHKTFYERGVGDANRKSAALSVDEEALRWEWMTPDNKVYSVYDQRLMDNDGHPMVLEMGVDITDLKAAKERLAETRVLLQAAIDNTPTGVIIASAPNGNILLVNSAAERLRGKTPYPLLGIPFEEHQRAWGLCQPDGTALSVERNPLAIAIREGKNVEHAELVLRSDSEEERWILVSSAPVRDGCGQIIAGVLIAADITDIKRTEKLIKARLDAITGENRGEDTLTFRELFNEKEIQKSQDVFTATTGVATIVIGPDGDALTRSSGIRDMDKIIRARHRDLVSDIFRERTLPIIVNHRQIAEWRVFSIPDNVKFERETVERLATKAGIDPLILWEDIQGLERLSVTRYERVVQTFAFISTHLSDTALKNIQQAREILARENAEKALEKTREHLRNVLDAMPSMLIGVNAEGKISQWNREAEKRTGISEERALGADPADVLKGFGFILDRARRAIASESPLIERKIPAEINDDVNYFDIMIYPLSAPNDIVIRADDVTDRSRLEEMVAYTNKMLSIGNLVTGIAHAINNPLGGIMLDAQNIRRRLSADFPKNREIANEIGLDFDIVREYLEERQIPASLDGIISAVDRAAAVVAELSRFSRKSDQQATQSDVVELLEDAIKLAANDYDLRSRFDFQRVRLIRDYPETPLPKIHCLAGELEQAFLNLLKNAARATQETNIEPTVEIRVRQEANGIRVEIHDNGIGVTEDVRKQYFSPLSISKSPDRELSFGLSVSYMIIALRHQGKLMVESSVGDGTTFLVYLPLGANTAKKDKA